MSETIQIAIVGSGHSGLVAAACFAEIGHNVICVGNDERKVAALDAGDILINEKNLPELLQRYRNTKIRFTTGLTEAMRDSDAIFIAMGIPQFETGDADLSYLEAFACEIARSLKSYKVIVQISRVPINTNKWIHRAIESKGVSSRLFDVVSSPEFFRRGSAVEDFLHPDRIVVGADSEAAEALLAEIYAPLSKGTYYRRADAIPGRCTPAQPPPLLNTSTKSAEIITRASNVFLALKISFINVVSNLCEVTDANIEQVTRGMGLDNRIGPGSLRPGIGYGGSCFPKEVAALRSVAAQFGIDFSLLTEVEAINLDQKKRFLSKVRSALWPLRGKRIGVLGLAFKGGTDDIRESPAVDLVEMLLSEGYSVAAFDPAARNRTAQKLPAGQHLCYVDDAYSAAVDADALVVLTDWPEFRELDLKRIYAVMRASIVVDGCNVFEPRLMHGLGFTYISIGRPAVYPPRDVGAADNAPSFLS
jgi:UDPglucose 6-dehydrogenase